MTLLLGIDIGTSSVKAMVMQPEGKISGFSQLDYDINIPSAGYAEQNPELWWDLVCRTISIAMLQAHAVGEDIAGIGFSGQMHGLVALDQDGNVLRPAIIWCDQRTIKQKEFIETTFTQKQLGTLVQNSVSTGFQLVSLMWIKENEPDIYNRIDKVILPKDYVRYRLTGRIGVETTDVSSTSAYNVANRHWSGELLTQVGIDPALFPEVGEPWEWFGTVSDQAASETGLKQGTPVVYGGADQPMQAIGNGIIHPGTVSCTIGTGGQLFTPIDQPIYDSKLRTHTYIHAVPDKWYLLGATMSAGLSLKWLATQVLNNQDFNTLTDKAKLVPPGSERLLFLPYLTGDRTPHMDPFSKGLFFGLTLKHHDAHLIRAVMEGVAYSLRDGLEIFKDLGADMKKIIVSGGGAKSQLWKQILADILDRDVYTSEMREQACVGAAMMAGIGVKIYDNLEHACATVVKINDIPVSPRDENRQLYEHQYAIYRKLYENNRDLFIELDTEKLQDGVVKV
ncbi:xylulose kinase [Paenibacillus swuensis]|uniref:Xylulose kinase n=1 Tax=Paenibacillus swuensis TaxID=1178515 RepID=A0A172TF19_9BACL|nr:xylulokinase [Paenibacillus swuensis]ANE45536.1 xylulose kinase [Paenibacillus swuensis]